MKTLSKVAYFSKIADIFSGGLATQVPNGPKSRTGYLDWAFDNKMFAFVF